MITFISGVPGAGKTLYAISKLLRALVGSVVKFEDEDGNLVEAPRRFLCNINGLLLDHVKLEVGAPWVLVKKGDRSEWEQGPGNKLGLNNWHEWARPGDVIVYDEVQKPWPLIAAGAPVPPCITALETHRHMGVDFIVLSQHPMLISANLVRLVGRHLHVRRMGNFGLAIVYEWDSASKTLLYKNALAKAPFRYDKSVFKLYKSADAHTQMPRRMPTLVWGLLFGLVALGFFFPQSYARLAERISPQPKPDTVAKPVAPGASAAASKPAQPASGAEGRPSPVQAPEKPPALVLAGCVQARTVCQCYNDAGKRVVAEPGYCADQMSDLLILARPKDVPPQTVAPGLLEGELDTLTRFGGRRGAAH
jgi:zona occludens toxin